MDVELHCASYYSFMHGTDSPERIVRAAAERGLRYLALTDRHGLYGIPEFIRTCRKLGVEPIVGMELEGVLDPECGIVSGPSTEQMHRDRWVILCRAADGYQQLTHWITQAHAGRAKAQPLWSWEHMQGLPLDHLTLMVGCKGSLLARLVDQGDLEAASAWLKQIKQRWRGDLKVELNNHHELNDAQRCIVLRELAHSHGLEVLIAGQARYLEPQQGKLFDVLQAIDQGVTVSCALLPTNHQAFLASAQQLKDKWVGFELEMAATRQFAQECVFSAPLASACLPVLPLKDASTQEDYLEQLCREAFDRYYAPQHLLRFEEELRLIKKLGLSGYFLVVWDIVKFAQRNNIPIQGRGSAANSMVAFLLGITAIDPVAHNLFLGRFLHEGMQSLPDIDLDIASDRCEELPGRECVIRYVYERYGSEHVAMVATFITFQERLAIREVGAAMEMPPVLIDALARLSGHRRLDEALEELVKDAAAATWFGSPLGILTVSLIRQIIGLPRHMGVHVGGMLISAQPISQLVPLEPAAMEGRIVCQWDKYQIEDAGLIKVDLLGLAMLGVIREAAALAAVVPESIPLDDPAVYDMLCRADTIGVFQVESRAQMQSLPQTQPRNLSELAVQISLIRPGPLQGKMVSPYIKRKQGREPINFMHPLAQPILAETLGVILYQEQVLQLAIAVAGFSAEQAAELRRAISRERSKAALQILRASFVQGATSRGLSVECADQMFQALAGFAMYGFCKSHALSFALLSARSAYFKRYFPAEFLVALLNHQPMGFYEPEILIADARKHGVRVLPIDIEYSAPLSSIQGGAVRLGLSLVHGWQRQRHDALILQARAKAPFSSFRHFLSCCSLPEAQIEQLIHAGAFDRFAGRRHLLWQLWHGARLNRHQPDLFGIPDAPVRLPRITEQELRDQECRAAGVSLRAHPAERLRIKAGLSGSAILGTARHGSVVTLIGRVISRQKPPTAKGYAFMTLDDIDGLWNVIVSPQVYHAYRRSFRMARYLQVSGVVQRNKHTINIVATSLVVVSS